MSTNPVDWGYPNVNIYGFDGIGEPVNYPRTATTTPMNLRITLPGIPDAINSSSERTSAAFS